MLYHMLAWVSILVTTQVTIRLWEFCTVSRALPLLGYSQMCKCMYALPYIFSEISAYLYHFHYATMRYHRVLKEVLIYFVKK